MSINIINDRCFKRLHELNLHNNKDYQQRLKKEIAAIDNQNMSGYLLDCCEKVKTIGKIKNSNHFLVSYLLEITNEDPLKNNLELIKTKYEEFPDIDCDFEDSKRDLVKDYLIQKYGKDNVATIITFGKNKAKATIKDICRVKNVPLEEVNKITKFFITGPNEDTIEKAYNNYPEVRDFFDRYEYLNLYKLCKKLEGNVRQPGKHASGFVISPVSLTDVVGLMTVKGVTVTCWEEGIEHKELSKIGLIKYDILGLKTLSVLNDTLKYIKERHDININLSLLNLKDEKIIKEFYDSNSVGIFQFEKDKLRQLMRKVKITEFSDISAINALNRPGPLDVGMDEMFWKVKNGVIQEKYLHEKLKDILKETHGVVCISKNSNVYIKNGIKKIQDVEVDDLVLTHDGTYKKVLKNIHKGERKTLRIRVSNGEELICTAKHMVLTSEGWKKAIHLKKNDLIKSFWLGEEKINIGDNKDWLIGLALADGDLTASTIDIACSSKEFAEKVKEIADIEFELNCSIYFNTRCWHVSLRKNNDIHYKSKEYVRNRFTQTIEDLGLKNLNSYTKKLPKNYTLSTIAGFIEGDGSLFTHCIRIKNREMSFQIYKALQEYRIHSSYFYDKKENVDTITFRDIENKIPFRIKEEKRTRRTDVYIPKNNLTYISTDFEAHRAFYSNNKNRFFSKFMLDKFECKYEHDVWSRVLSVKRNGSRQVYDLSIDTNHNFVVGGLVVHNCYQEQIIKIVQELAGMNEDEADNFRRVLTKDSQAGRSKGINPLEKYEKVFMEGCLKNGVNGRTDVKRTIYDDVEIPNNATNVKVIEEKKEINGESKKVISCNVDIANEIFHQIKSFAGYGFNKCLVGTTRVKFKDYSSIKVGTLFKNKDSILKNMRDVMSINEDATEINYNRIVDVTESGVQDVYLLTSRTSKKNLICTKNHKIRTNHGWKELGDIAMNDKILLLKNGELFWDDILTIRYYGKEMTYDVSLRDQDHPYFFANNFVVHNSHSTAYAYLAFASMYLKTYYTKEFMSMLLTHTDNTVNLNDGENDFINYVEEVKRLEINLLPPHINKSDRGFKIEDDNIRSGFIFLKGVADKSIENIIKNRPFRDVKDFLIRTDGRAISKTVFHALVNSGSFDCFLATGETIRNRFEFINQYNSFRKNKIYEVYPTLEEVVAKESEICGGEIFNSIMGSFDIKKINQKYQSDDKIMNFKTIDKISEENTIRVFGKIEKYYEKNVGFVDIRNGNDKKSFVLWNSDLEYLKKHPEIKILLQINNIITFKAKRNKDYNGKKSFNIIPKSVERMT